MRGVLSNLKGSFSRQLENTSFFLVTLVIKVVRSIFFLSEVAKFCLVQPHSYFPEVTSGIIDLFRLLPQ